MYLKPFGCEDNKHEILEGGFRNLNFSPSTKKTTEYSFELFLSIYRYQILDLLKIFKTLLFQKRRWSCDFPPRKTPIARKHLAISCQEKTAFSTAPPSSCLGTPLPLPQCLYGQTGGRTGGRTLTSQPNFSDRRLPNLLSDGAPLSGCARGLRYKSRNREIEIKSSKQVGRACSRPSPCHRVILFPKTRNFAAHCLS